MQYFKIFQDISRYFKIFQDISRYFKIFQDISRYFKIFQVQHGFATSHDKVFRSKSLQLSGRKVTCRRKSKLLSVTLGQGF